MTTPNGVPRPSSLLQPTRVAPPAPGAGESAPLPQPPAQGQPGGEDMQALLALLMMLMQQGGGAGMGAPAGMPPQGAPMPGMAPGGPASALPPELAGLM